MHFTYLHHLSIYTFSKNPIFTEKWIKSEKDTIYVILNNAHTDVKNVRNAAKESKKLPSNWWKCKRNIVYFYLLVCTKNRHLSSDGISLSFKLYSKLSDQNIMYFMSQPSKLFLIWIFLCRETKEYQNIKNTVIKL